MLDNDTCIYTVVCPGRNHGNECIIYHEISIHTSKYRTHAFFLQPQFLKSDSNFGQYQSKRQTEFKPGNADNTMRILLVWGMKEQDVSDCHITAPDCWGENVWDNTFNLNETSVQEKLMVMYFKGEG